MNVFYFIGGFLIGLSIISLFGPWIFICVGLGCLIGEIIYKNIT